MRPNSGLKLPKMGRGMMNEPKVSEFSAIRAKTNDHDSFRRISENAYSASSLSHKGSEKFNEIDKFVGLGDTSSI